MGLLRSDLAKFAADSELPESMGRASAIKIALLGASNPGIYAIVLYRFAAALRRRDLLVLAAIVSLINVFLTGADIDQRAIIGPGLRVHHPVGVVIHGDARLGARATLFSDVVIGQRGPGHTGAPVIGDDLLAGTGAKVLGSVTIGDRVSIGANAVVLGDVPDDHRAVGVPARSIPAPPVGP